MFRHTLGTCKRWPQRCLKCIEVCLLLFWVNYDLRRNSYFAVPSVKSVFHGSKCISYLGPKIWDIVSLELKQLTSLNAFERVLKTSNQKIVLAGYVSNAYYFRNLLWTSMLFLTHFRLGYFSPPMLPDRRLLSFEWEKGRIISSKVG